MSFPNSNDNLIKRNNKMTKNYLYKKHADNITLQNKQKNIKQLSIATSSLNPIALRMAKKLWSFGHSECKRVKLNASSQHSDQPAHLH